MILLFMGFVIVYLGYKEAQEDKRDHYNFIQLIRWFLFNVYVSEILFYDFGK